jgi:hypothetical protein
VGPPLWPLFYFPIGDGDGDGDGERFFFTARLFVFGAPAVRRGGSWLVAGIVAKHGNRNPKLEYPTVFTR